MESERPLGATDLNALYEDQVASIKSFELPLYGLDRPPLDGGLFAEGLAESRRVDPGTGATIARTVECALVHGAPDVRDRPYVRVATTTDPDASLPWRLVVRVEPTPFEERIQAIPDADYTPPGAARTVVDIAVDHRPTAFEVLRRGPHFVANHMAENHEIVLEGRGIDPAELSLVTVEDLQPYIDGFWERHRP